MLLVNTSLPAPVYSDLSCTYGSGLTPAEDQWIVIFQYHYMKNDSSSGIMKENMFPVGLAYGFTNSFSLMVLESIIEGNMNSGSGSMNTDEGMSHGISYDDPLLIGKYKLYRINRHSYTFGIAFSLGVEIPAGNYSESTDTMNILPGLSLTGRYGNLKSDFNVTYKWKYVSLMHSNSHGNPADELNMTMTAYYQVPFGPLSSFSIAPVIELSMVDIRGNAWDGHRRYVVSETDVYTGYGIKFSSYHFILDFLVRVPIHTRGDNVNRDDLFILAGSSFMF